MEVSSSQYFVPAGVGKNGEATHVSRRARMKTIRCIVLFAVRQPIQNNL